MRAFLAVFRDAWRESIDRRSVQVLLALGVLLAIVCASFSYTVPDPGETLAKHASELGEFTRPLGFAGGRFAILKRARASVSEVRGIEPEDDLPSGIEDARVVELRFPSLEELDDLVHDWRAFRSRPLHRADDAAPRPSGPVTTRDRTEFLRERFQSAGFSEVIARPIGGDEREWRIAAHAERPMELSGPWRLGVLFDAADVELEAFGPAQFFVMLELGIANGFVGFAGMLVLLSTFAATVPELVRKGAIDLVLARPIGRARLLLYRYAAAVLTVLGIAFVIFGLCSAALLACWGLFQPMFLACSLTAAAVFAILFPVALLLGLVTRSAGLATLGSFACWGLASSIVQGRDALRMFDQSDSKWGKALDVAYWIAPKTRDFDKLNEYFLSRTQLSAEAVSRVAQSAAAPVDWWFSAGTSALFAGVVISIALYLFHRRDL